MTVLVRFSAVLFTLLLCANLAVAAPGYVQSPSLNELAAKVKVGEVSTKSPTQVPIITWGGDIATILANGNAGKTGANSLFAKQGLKFNLVREDIFPRQVQAYLEGK